MSEIKVYYDPESVEPRPENEGLYGQGGDRLLARLGEARAEYSVVDSAALSREEIEDAYVQLAVVPSVRQRYGIRRLFGTHKYPGGFFGRQVPALIVFENGRPVDVYPHEEGGRVVTIKEYLDKLAKGGARGRELAKRMDALRAKIGVVGVNARALINEGRRR